MSKKGEHPERRVCNWRSIALTHRRGLVSHHVQLACAALSLHMAPFDVCQMAWN